LLHCEMRISPKFLIRNLHVCERLQWVGSGLSRPPLNFQPGNLLCCLDRLDSAKSRLKWSITGEVTDNEGSVE
jgi:hypothetical protein